jgi:hypothetical protein
MTTTTIRRIGAIVGAVAITATGAFASSTASAQTGQHDTTDERPCFMIQPHWNDAEGPQPTCPTPSWQQARQATSSGTTSATRSVPQARITDFMP